MPASIEPKWFFISFDFKDTSLDVIISVHPNFLQNDYKSIQYIYDDKTKTTYAFAHPASLDPKDLKKIIKSTNYLEKLIFVFHKTHYTQINEALFHLLGKSLYPSRKNFKSIGISKNKLIEDICECASDNLDPQEIVIQDIFDLGEKTMGLQVQAVMTVMVRRVDIEMTLNDAKATMDGDQNQRRVRNLPVVESVDVEDQIVVGFIDDRELLLHYPTHRANMAPVEAARLKKKYGNKPIKDEVMRANPLLVTPGMPIEEAALLLCTPHEDALRYNAAPVVNNPNDRILVGLFSYIDVLKSWEDTSFSGKTANKTVKDIMKKADPEISFKDDSMLIDIFEKVVKFHREGLGERVREVPILNTENKILAVIRDRIILEAVTVGSMDIYSGQEVRIMASTYKGDNPGFKSYTVEPITVKIDTPVSEVVTLLKTRRL